MPSKSERIRIAEESVQRAIDRLQSVVDEPDEPKIGSIIRFKVAFEVDDTAYEYAAIHAENNLWYVTNQTAPHSWERLLSLMRRTKQKRGPRFYLYGKRSPGSWVEVGR